MAEKKVVQSPTAGNGISEHALEQSCLEHAHEIGEIGHAVNAISELLDNISDRTGNESYSQVFGSAYMLASLGKRLSDLASEVDDMPRRFRAKEVGHE
ncbi:hypothetical protein [uncultured Pseudodesulfovibrio sp.]|uniref:hypothetical protein n=1 Tax=uncultured Pseudodesulfovibrio sp. TaxID=2035858 RepID=UPI0029C77999|nr:hypothetical protein [uncultured Pseudodesulfovibrio sp.]